MDVKMSSLQTVNEPSENDRVLICHDPNGNPKTMTVTVSQLLGMQQKALRRKCLACGTVGCYDMRGNCGACGHPFED